MSRKTNLAYEDDIIEVFKTFDPDGDMVPGSSEYNHAQAMIVKWIHLYGLARALELAEQSKQLLDDVMRLN